MTQDVKTVKTKSCLIKLLNELLDNGKYVFRGYSYKDQLLPNIIRRGVVTKEKKLLFEFERNANQYLNTSNPIDFMSYAQHYGLSTRLLDFTYNPFIALFFSIFDSKNNKKCKDNEDKQFYYIRYCDVKSNILIHHVPILDILDCAKIDSMAKRCADLFEMIDIMFKDNTNFNRDNIISLFFKTLATRTMELDPDVYYEANLKKINK